MSADDGRDVVSAGDDKHQRSSRVTSATLTHIYIYIYIYILTANRQYIRSM